MTFSKKVFFTEGEFQACNILCSCEISFGHFHESTTQTRVKRHLLSGLGSSHVYGLIFFYVVCIFFISVQWVLGGMYLQDNQTVEKGFGIYGLAHITEAGSADVGPFSPSFNSGSDLCFSFVLFEMWVMFPALNSHLED